MSDTETSDTSSEPTETDAEANAAPRKKGLGPTALRFATAIPIIPGVIWLLFSAPKYGFQIFGYFWTAIAGYELMRMVAPNSLAVRAWGTLATIGVFSTLLFVKHDAALPSVIVALALGALVVSLAAPDPVDKAAQRVGMLFGGPIYIGGTLGTMGLLHQYEHGGAWLLLTMFFAFLSDTGAYFAGRTFGKHKLYPKLSPKKTVEGAIGGLVGAMIGALALQQTLLNEVLPLTHAIVLSLVAAALGQAGDLLESLLKRSTGVKDSGNIMPGHGGLLDRSDALMFTGATTWLYVTWLLP